MRPHGAEAEDGEAQPAGEERLSPTAAGKYHPTGSAGPVAGRRRDAHWARTGVCEADLLSLK